MVVDYPYVIGTVVFPSETQSPLLIDSDAMLPCPIPGQELQSIASQTYQILQCFSAVYDRKPARRLVSEALEVADPLTLEKSFGVSVLEASNHGS